MKLILKNDNSGYQKNPNVKVIETTESTFENQVVIIEENDIPVIKFTDLGTSYNIKSLQDKYRHSNSEVSIDITEDDLEIISNGNGGGDFIPLSGTTEGNPVTGDIEFYSTAEERTKGFLSFNDTGELGLISRDRSRGVLPHGFISNDVYFSVEDSYGFKSDTDHSEINPTDKLIYAQRSYVDKANSYSTTETLTGGTWIDGKPIYRKTFYQEVISSVLLSTKLFYADISNLDIETILPCKITINKGISTYFSADDFNRDNNVDFQNFKFRVIGTDVEFAGNCLTADLNVKTIVILEYTKTTD